MGAHARESDRLLDPELADLLQTQRCLVKMVARKPSRADIRKTLEKLLSLDEPEQAAAIPLVDAYTEAELATGALRWYRLRIPSGPLPPEFFRVELHEPDARREMIRLALEHLLQRRADGRRSVLQRDVDFAVRLIRYWEHQHKKTATVFLDADDKPSPFLKFAGECFHSVGRAISYDPLRKIISAAKRQMRSGSRG